MHNSSECATEDLRIDYPRQILWVRPFKVIERPKIHCFEVAVHVHDPRNDQDRNVRVELQGQLQHLPAFKCWCALADDHYGDGFGLNTIDAFARGRYTSGFRSPYPGDMSRRLEDLEAHRKSSIR